MGDILPRSRASMGAELARILDRDAARVRGQFAMDVHDDATEATWKKREANAYTVKARIAGNGVVFDVFEIVHPGTPQIVRREYVGRAWRMVVVQEARPPVMKFIIGPFVSCEEATARAGDLLLGRVAVHFGGVRATFERAGRGELARPSLAIDAPHQHEIRVSKARDGSLTLSRPPRQRTGTR